MFQNFEEVQKLAKVNLDASMKSIDLMAKNAQTIVNEMSDYTKRSFENSTRTLERLMGAKTFDKAVEVQSEYAKTAFDDYVAETAKLSQLCANLGKEAFKPYEGFMSKAPTR